MINCQCKYSFRELVFIDWGDEDGLPKLPKIIGEITSHRILENGRVLYTIPMAHVYVPEEIVYKLNKKQEIEYEKAIIGNHFNTEEECINAMQYIFDIK